jgi:hypothetical protein
MVNTVTSCSRSEIGNGSDFEIVKEYNRGSPATFTVKVSRARLSTVDELSFVLEAKAAEQWSAVFPEIGDSLDKFSIVDRGIEIHRLDPERNLVHTRIYTLEPFLSGDYVIPPIEMFFEEQEKGFSFSLTSEEIAIEVVSILPPQLGEQDIEGIQGPMPLRQRMVVWIGIGAIVLAAFGAGLLYVSRRINVFQSETKDLHPWKKALNELDALLEKKLIEHGSYREFYDSISDLTRRYVELRFSIRAPAQTTEEFLQQVRESKALAEFAPLLDEFLYGCDLVKFARYRSSVEEAKKTVRICEKFLTETAPQEVDV